jgi:hypothetical protein
MKPVAILTLVAVCALAGTVLLFVEVQDLRDQLAYTRADTRPTTTYDHLALEARLERVENRLAQLAAPTAEPEVYDVARLGAATDDAPAAARPGTDSVDLARPDAALPDSDDEAFRARVQRAQELNRIERRRQDLVDLVDRLANDRRIGPLNDKQKAAVAEVILAVRETMPETIRGIMRKPENRNLPREERFTLVRTEFERVRTETAQKLEEATIPAADAAVIAQEALDFGPGMGRRRPER